MRRHRNVKIVATLGPSSSDHETIRALFDAGADVFRMNMSHGSHDDHLARLRIIRAIEEETGRPIAVLADLQGPKLRVGQFGSGPVELSQGQAFRFDLDDAPGDDRRVQLPHPEIFAALEAGSELLVNDGKIRLRVRGLRAGLCQLHGDHRRHHLRPQGGERARRGAALGRAVGQGPRRSGIRLRGGGGLAGAVVRATPRGRDRGAQPGPWPRSHPVQDRKARRGARVFRHP